MFVSHLVAFCSLRTNWIICWDLGVKGICWMVLEARHLMKGVYMRVKEKQRLRVKNTLSKSRGKPVKKISRCWTWSNFRWWSEDRTDNPIDNLVCSLNVSCDGMGCTGELSEYPIQHQAQRLPIHDLLWGLPWKSLPSHPTSACRALGRDSFSSQWFQVRREEKMALIWRDAVWYGRKLEFRIQSSLQGDNKT